MAVAGRVGYAIRLSLQEGPPSGLNLTISRGGKNEEAGDRVDSRAAASRVAADCE